MAKAKASETKLGMPVATVFMMNYNGLMHAKRCLDAIEKQTVRHNLVFMDNRSTDGSFEYASKRLAGRKGSAIFRSDRNRYVAYLEAKAMDMCKTRYAAFCHIDCVPEKRWLEKMIRVAEKEKAGAVEPEIVHPNGQVLHGSLTRWFSPTLTGKCERHPLVVCTAATLYRNTRLKIFNPSYLHYHDEDHASEVLKRHGWPLVHIGDCLVLHAGSHSGLLSPKWKLLSRFNQARMVLTFNKPAKNPAAA